MSVHLAGGSDCCSAPYLVASSAGPIWQPWTGKGQALMEQPGHLIFGDPVTLGPTA